MCVYPCAIQVEVETLVPLSELQGRPHGRTFGQKQHCEYDPEEAPTSTNSSNQSGMAAVAWSSQLLLLTSYSKPNKVLASFPHSQSSLTGLAGLKGGSLTAEMLKPFDAQIAERYSFSKPLSHGHTKTTRPPTWPGFGPKLTPSSSHFTASILKHKTTHRSIGTSRRILVDLSPTSLTRVK